jgi:flagellar operon protein
MNRFNCQQQPVNLVELSLRDRAAAQETQSVSFKQMFSGELAASHRLNFSRHAHERMFSRGIELSDETIGRMAEALDKAQSKGSRETLVLAEDAAFVVSVDNRTVITAFDREHLRQGVVTSIDSAVIV